MPSLRSFTPFGLRASAAPASGWTRSAAPERKRSRWLFAAGAVSVAAALGGWTAVRTVPWFGPLVADTLRSVVGGERVTALEEAVANVEDHVARATTDGKARSLEEATPAALLDLPSTPQEKALERALAPSAVSAPFAKVAAAGDGTWSAVPTRIGDAPLYRTMLHPDPERSYAELFVFALDLSRFEVHAVAGSIEPRSEKPLRDVERPGLVPDEDRSRLVAAFNGGFKAEHGKFGMMADGAELLRPQPYSCTIGGNADGTITIGTWKKLGEQAPTFSWWRQTPGCMLENGVLHPGLRSDETKNWGATLEGKTVIRRSAAGLSADGKTLFVGISNATTARALALGMKQAGAVSVAQLDVNFSFPRFLVYQPDADTGALTALGAVKGLLYSADEYVGRASSRDFFYVTAR